MIQAREVANLLRTFDPGIDGEIETSRELILALLAYSPDPFSRDVYAPGHITCTGAVLAPDRKAVLLVHHKRLDRWLLPGGHVERQDATIGGVARRDVLEETGAALSDIAPRLVGMDVHPIPPGKREPLHLHHDLIFAFQAQSKQFQVSEESRAVAWCSVEEFGRYDLPGSIRRSVLRAVLDIQAN
ncbi:MAG: NUDIX domain-containing protein [Bryobacteraceae bacterium]